MGRLLEIIRDRVAGGRYVVGQHATERLDERGVLEWQVVEGLEEGSLIIEPLLTSAQPNPSRRGPGNIG